jgi:hypothetical protein
MTSEMGRNTSYDNLQEQERRRQEERNMFSSYAIGGTGIAASSSSSSSFNPNHIHTSSTGSTGSLLNDMQHQSTSPHEYDSSSLLFEQPLNAMNHSIIDTTKDDTSILNQQPLLGAASPFTMKTQQNANLAAAAAALSLPTNETPALQSSPVISSSSIQSNHLSLNPSSATTSNTTAINVSKTAAVMSMTTHTLHHSQHSSDMKAFTESNNGDITTSLFSEQVICHRPLFFGPIIPPTVLQKAQQMIHAAITEQQLIHNNPTPLLQDLPDSVRNVVGVLRTYGYGLDKCVYTSSSSLQPSVLLKGSSGSSIGSNPNAQSNINSNHSDSTLQTSTSIQHQSPNRTNKWRGNGTVSTFQPVWGTDIRAERLQSYLTATKRTGMNRNNVETTSIQKPRIVARVSTAPALFSQSPDKIHPNQIRPNPSSDRKYKYDDNDDDDDDEEEVDSDDVNEKNVITNDLVLENKQFNTDTVTEMSTLDRQSSANTTSSSSSKTPLYIDTSMNNNTTTLEFTSTPNPNEQFSAWLRGGVQQMDDIVKSSKSPTAIKINMSTKSSGIRNQSTNETNTTSSNSEQHFTYPQNSATSRTSTAPASPAILDRNMFAQWVQAGNNDSTPTNNGTMILEESSPDNKDIQQTHQSFRTTDTVATTTVAETVTENAYDGSTFQRLPSNLPGGGSNHDNSNNTNDDSDDDSLIDDEQNTQVGANDNLNKAVAMFSDGLNQSNDMPILEQQSQNILLSQVDGSRKRPMTNYELTGGYVPMFGVDDTPLPQLSDLGTYETEEDQHRAMDQKRSQDIIEKFVPPNIFGSIACPNPANGPDDFHSWNSRAVAPLRHNTRNSMASIASDPSGIKRTTVANSAATLHQSKSTVGGSGSTVQASTSKPPRPRNGGSKSSKDPHNKQRGLLTSRDRYGWWYEPNEVDETNATDQPTNNDVGDNTDDMKDDDATDDPSLQLPPLYHSSSKMQVLTSLEPKMDDLKKENIPLSQLHAATSMVQALPYLSDRPHSHRYLQIDTKQIAFPPLKGEIEPLFCSLAVYNVETISTGGNGMLNNTASSNKISMSAAPIPDLQRCGRITEALYFDYVSDPDVENRCTAALWPYFKSNLLSDGIMMDNEDTQKLRGTTCGVFPLPSNLNVANLYAVLIVRKVLSDESDFEPYLKPRKTIVDLDKLKQNAERASNRNGPFLVPFAFGVAPLLQVFGSDNPIVASSRAVQIPLFHFSDGERQIIDHIMVMLFPRYKCFSVFRHVLLSALRF